MLFSNLIMHKTHSAEAERVATVLKAPLQPATCQGQRKHDPNLSRGYFTTVLRAQFTPCKALPAERLALSEGSNNRQGSCVALNENSKE